jgi:transposase
MASGKHEAATVAATVVKVLPRIEIVSDRRQAHSTAFRANVVAEAMAPGARIHDIAERYGICPSLVYRWRRTAGAPAAEAPSLQLFPMRLSAADEAAPPSPAADAAAQHRTGSIEIEIGRDVRVRVEESVSLAALRRVMSVLRG